MSAAQHTPGAVCDACEGHCLLPAGRVVAGAELSLRIGQRVTHREHRGRRVTGVLRGLSIDSDRVLQADMVLDEAIVIPPHAEGERPINIWWHHVPAHELAPFDDRDELIAGLLDVAKRCEQRLAGEKWLTDGPREALPPEAVLLLDLRAAIAKASGEQP